MTFEGGSRPGRHVVPVHLVVVTRYRRGVLAGAMLSYCQAAMRKSGADSGAGLREFNGAADHVRLLASYPPKAAVSALVNSLTGVSARRLRAGRVNRGAPLGIIRQYIEQQPCLA